MRLERGIRSAALKPYPVGYLAPTTDEFNTEEPYLRMGGIKDLGVWIDEENFPIVIDLCVRITPFWAENSTATIALDSNEPCLIYPSNSVFSRVNIDFTGNGFYQKISGGEKVSFIGVSLLDYELEIPQPNLYQKVFLTQSYDQNIHWQTLDKNLQASPPLWAYGAQQVLDDIHPFVFGLEGIRHATCLRASSLLTWRERGILPIITDHNERGNNVFQDRYALDQTRSLKESIEAGMSIVTLKIGIEGGGNILSIKYRSFRFVNNIISYKKGG
jgi:hypothetical protein